MMLFNDFVHKHKNISSSFFFVEDDVCDTYKYMSFYTRVYTQNYLSSY